MASSDKSQGDFRINIGILSVMMSSWIFKEGFEQWVIFFFSFPKTGQAYSQVVGRKQLKVV